MVGAAAADILLGAGATRNQDNPDWIKASIRLPTHTFDYVHQWGESQSYDTDKDIRNNMLGADHVQDVSRFPSHLSVAGYCISLLILLSPCFRRS